MKKSEVERLLDPTHVWAIGRGENRSVVMLLNQPRAIEYERPGVDLFLLSELWVAPKNRGKGHATELLRAVTIWADESKTDLWLYIAPFENDKTAMKYDDLWNMYNRHKFMTMRDKPDHEMVRRHARPRS